MEAALAEADALGRSPLAGPRQHLPWWEQTLRGQRRGWLAEAVRRLALLGSWGYKAGVRGRELAYQHGWFRVRRLPRLTVCVGNITVGGTGKTPLVIRLVQDLLERGLRPAVLLRGYRRAKVLSRPVVVRDPQGIRAGLPESGDEAMELAERLPKICIGVGADRYSVGSHLLRHYPIDCFVLDDGFQHYRLGRDLNIVTVDVTDPWGGGKLLPAGLLRESPEALRRSDVVVLTRTSLVAPDRLAVLRAEVASFVRDPAWILESRHEPRVLLSLKDRKEQSLAGLKGRSILAVSGIANPQAFEAGLRRLGADVRRTFRLADHGGRPREVWKWVARNRRPDEWVIMTEKDALRWSAEPMREADATGLFALRMELEIIGGEKQWDQLLDRLTRLAPLTR
jgi:tetraacyldisaccharide 4'-kinase